MKLKSFLIVPLIVLANKGLGQDFSSKISMSATSSYAFLGDGDYGAFYYDNGVSFNIKPLLQISGELGFLISSNDGEKSIHLSHNYSYILGDIIFKIIPITTKHFYSSFGFGNSNRYSSEIRMQSLKTVNDQTFVEYNNEVSFYFGYVCQLNIGFMISSKSTIFINSEFHGFNRGTSIASFGLGFNHIL